MQDLTPPVQVPILVRTENLLPPRYNATGSDRDSVMSTMGSDATSVSDVGAQLLQVLREAASSSGGGSSFTGGKKLLENYPDGHTMQTLNRSLAEPWNIIPPEEGPVKEYYKVRDANLTRTCSLETS
jgi:hypothetical protein